MPRPTHVPAEASAPLLQRLTGAVLARMGREQLALALIALLRQLFAELAALVAAGLDIPRTGPAAPGQRPAPSAPLGTPLPHHIGRLPEPVPAALGGRAQGRRVQQNPEPSLPKRRAPRPRRRRPAPQSPPIPATPTATRPTTTPALALSHASSAPLRILPQPDTGAFACAFRYVFEITARRRYPAGATAPVRDEISP
jgi:hypothetical protein